MQYNEFDLKNGIHVITVPTHGTKAVTVMAMFPVGSRYENKKLSGASHFVEHMMFKGTERRPTYLDISRELDSVGAEYNAFTSKDFTGYYIKINTSQMNKAFSMLSDMIFNSKLEEKEVEKEKGVICEEIKMYDDNPTMAVDNLFDFAMFGDHPLGWDVAGTKDTVIGLSRQELNDYYKKYYIPGNMVLAVAGNFDENELKKSLEFFENAERDSGANRTRELTGNFEKFEWQAGDLEPEKRTQVSERKLDQAHVILGFPGLPYDHPDRSAASVLLNILGGGMSSRLFVEVREKRGLAYMVHAGGSSFREVGQAVVQAGLDPSRLGDAFKVIRQELEKISTEPVTAKELENSKNFIAGHMALGMEDSSAQAQWFVKQFLFFKKMETYEDVIEEIKKVKIEDVQKLAQRFFKFNQMRIAVISPLSKEKILSMLK
ncbi:MAG: pitrilysin family protein [Patescibacteria group bacterium]